MVIGDASQNFHGTNEMLQNLFGKIFTQSGAFGTFDLVFFLAYMGIVLWIGFAVGRREKATIEDYFRAGNTLPWFAVGFSIIAAGTNSVNLVAENGLAYQRGIAILNWEWMIFPALSILLWIFIPIYLRNRITTMPEYLERRYGPTSRTLYACLIVASYVFAVFATVFYSAGFTLETLWGINRYWAIAIVALATGAYTVYGGLASVAWTDLFQCLLLLGSGIFVFFAGMAHIGWDFAKLVGDGQRAHLMAPASDPMVPWTAMIILALSTNTWWYASDQCINQRCLGAKNEWHAKMGVLLAGAIQLVLPLAVCFAGLIYHVMDPNLEVADEAYIRMVREVVPAGLRGLVAAALLGAIMSAVSGLVNSTSTIVTLDIVRRWKGKDWPEAKLVRFGQFAGATALLLGALIAPVVMNWKSMFMYSQDIWAPMAAPAVVAFLGGALWRPGKERGAVACMWLAILTVPLTFSLKFINEASPDTAREYWAYWAFPILPAVIAVILIGSLWLTRFGKGRRFAALGGVPMLFVTLALYLATALHDANRELPMTLQTPMVWAGGIYLFAIALMIILSLDDRRWRSRLECVAAAILIAVATALSGALIAILVLATIVLSIAYFCINARQPQPYMWDRTMVGLPSGEKQNWYANLWLWWLAVAGIFVAIYVHFW
jgi:solute:Na+ symporter, SSS family